MKPPLFIRPLSAMEEAALETGLRSRDAFTLRRSQILRASARGYRPSQIAESLGCGTQTVRKVLRAFRREGVECLAAKSQAPKRVQAIWSKARDEALRELLHQRPRGCGNPRSPWTLQRLAKGCFERGMTSREGSDASIRRTLKRLDIHGKRAKHWMTSPDPHYARKKAHRDRLMRLAAHHPEWVLGFADEVWWSRVAQPALHAWPADAPMQVQLLQSDAGAPDPDAVACYGFLRHDTHTVLLRFVEGRPLGELTMQCLAWLCECVAQERQHVRVVIWDNASWHISAEVTWWVQAQNQRAKRGKDVRVVIGALPAGSPWLNNIAPCWTHAKRAILAVDRKVTASEITHRVCEHFGCELLPYLKPVSAGDGALTSSLSSPHRSGSRWPIVAHNSGTERLAP
jgi:transposase